MTLRVLLVEGDDDQHVMWNLRDVRKAWDGVYVLQPGDSADRSDAGKVIRRKKNGGRGKDEDGGGFGPLLESIPARLDTTGLASLAVVVDADHGVDSDGKINSDYNGPQARWDAVQARLIDEGYEKELLPKRVAPKGTVLELPARRGRRPIRFGLWVMPDNCHNGMLEDFYAQMIDDEDMMLKYVDQFLGETIPKDERRFVDVHESKARVHAWLAVSERPGRPMGQAIKANATVRADRELVDRFVAWVDRVMAIE